MFEERIFSHLIEMVFISHSRLTKSSLSLKLPLVLLESEVESLKPKTV